MATNQQTLKSSIPKIQRKFKTNKDQLIADNGPFLVLKRPALEWELHSGAHLDLPEALAHFHKAVEESKALQGSVEVELWEAWPCCTPRQIRGHYEPLREEEEL